MPLVCDFDGRASEIEGLRLRLPELHAIAAISAARQRRAYFICDSARRAYLRKR